jgi:parallel beta-helix repeat protein
MPSRFIPDGGETMRIRNGFGVTLFFFFALVFYSTPSFADTNVSGDITANTTWTLAHSPYIVTGNIRVYGTSVVPTTLTIESGVVVKFNNNTGLSISFSTSQPGALQAVGTAAAPIIFTSATTTPTPGIWTGLTLNGSTINSMLDYVTVEYGVKDIYLANVSSTVTIKDSIIRNSSTKGIDTYSSTASIQNNTIVNNGTYGFYDESTSGTVVSGNTFSGNGSYPAHMGINQTGSANTYGTNGINAIETVGGQVGQSLTMKNNGIPYLVTSTVTVYGSSATSPPAVLTVEPGVTVKFSPQKGLQIGNGSSYPGVLISQGTPTSPILFTSGTTTPARGDWSGITLDNAPSSASDIEYTTVEYGGYGANYFNANLYLSASSPTVRNCLIRNSAGSGIYLYSVTNAPLLSDNEITGNKWGISTQYFSNPSIRNSKIYANSTAGVSNFSTGSIPDVDARGNWWGVASGPTYTAGNPGGRGDAISDHVPYNPWLGQTPAAAVSFRDARVMPLSLNPFGGFVTFEATISLAANWTITITDGNNNTVRTFTGTGTAINQAWYGDNNQSLQVADGTYNYRIDAADPVSGSSAAPLQGFIAVSSQYPVNILTIPVDDQMFPLGAVLNITGTATDPTNFKNYVLEYGAGANPLSWTNLKTSTTPVTNGLLYAWNTTSLTGNLYTLRFTVTDNTGNAVIETALVRFIGIQNVTVSTGYISPNNDGIQDATTIGATINQQGNWTITIKNASGTAVRTFTGTGTSISQAWDGRDAAGTVVPDGTYTYQLDAASTETSVAALSKTGTIIVDTTQPVALITAPSLNSVLTGTVQITGTASDANLNNYRVDYGPASGLGPWSLISSVTTSVNGGTLATWVTSDQSGTVLVPNGNYIIRLTVTDQAGNSTITTVPIGISNLNISNISISSNSINTMSSESSSIFFTLNSAATATFKVIPERLGPTGTPIYQTSQACAAAGAYGFTWNGTDNTGKVVPDDAYLLTIDVSDGIRSVSYSPAAPTGSGSVTCSQSPNSDPLSNQPMTITYTPTLPSRVTVSVSWGSQNFNILTAYAATPVSHQYVWDVRNPSGQPLDYGALAWCSVASLLRENYVITSGDTPQVSGLATDPYAMTLSYGQFTRIKYALSRDSIVTIQLVSPSGVAITLVNNRLQAAGQQELDWTGMNPIDTTGKNALVSEEGDYMVTVRAMNPVTGSSSTAGGNLRIGQ